MGDAIAIATADGRLLSGEIFHADAPRGAVLIASAMGVRRRYYRPFAGHLARAGFTVLTFDYRGIGDSRAPGALRRERATLRDWGELDLPAALDVLASHAPGVPIGYVGHSVGGQIFGLETHDRVGAAVFVGSQSGWSGMWSGAGRLAMNALWYGAIPFFTSTLGYLPMSWAGQGEDLPRDVARDWAAWGRHPDYVMSYAGPRGGVGFRHWSGALRCYGFTDDPFAPERGVRTLARFYEGASVEVRMIEPESLGENAVGHFGFFRERFERTLWRSAADWLAAQLSPVTARTASPTRSIPELRGRA